MLVLDLYVAWATDPTLSVGVQMALGEWKVNSRYNALHLSTIIPPLVHKLRDLGMIELSKGSYSGPGHKGNRTTRIIAAKPLIALFEGHSFELLELEPPREQELVILRDASNKNLEYEDTDQTIKNREILTRYNELLWSSFIDLPAHDVAFIEREVRDGPRVGQVQRVAIGGNNFAC